MTFEQWMNILYGLLIYEFLVRPLLDKFVNWALQDAKKDGLGDVRLDYEDDQVL